MKKIFIKLFYIISVILIVAWLIGFIGYTTGSIIIILISVAIVILLLKVIQTKKSFKKRVPKY